VNLQKINKTDLYTHVDKVISGRVRKLAEERESVIKILEAKVKDELVKDIGPLVTKMEKHKKELVEGFSKLTEKYPSTTLTSFTLRNMSLSLQKQLDQEIISNTLWLDIKSGMYEGKVNLKNLENNSNILRIEKVAEAVAKRCSELSGEINKLRLLKTEARRVIRNASYAGRAYKDLVSMHFPMDNFEPEIRVPAVQKFTVDPREVLGNE